MRTPGLIVFLFAALSVPAGAQVTPSQLADVRVDARAGAALPLSLRFADAEGATRSLGESVGGTPAVIVFADYTCTNICGPVLALAAAGLTQTGLSPGKDFHLVVIGLDPKDGAGEARRMGASHVGADSPLARASTFLIGNADALRGATEAAGYHYVYDREHDQFAHPAAAFVVAKDGRIVRVLSGLGLTGDNLRLALVDAGRGRVGGVLDQIKLHCFGFDPVRGLYTASIMRMLAIAGGTTVLLLLCGLVFLTVVLRRRAAT